MNDTTTTKTKTTSTTRRDCKLNNNNHNNNNHNNNQNNNNHNTQHQLSQHNHQQHHHHQDLIQNNNQNNNQNNDEDLINNNNHSKLVINSNSTDKDHHLTNHQQQPQQQPRSSRRESRLSKPSISLIDRIYQLFTKRIIIPTTTTTTYQSSLINSTTTTTTTIPITSTTTEIELQPEIKNTRTSTTSTSFNPTISQRQSTNTTITNTTDLSSTLFSPTPSSASSLSHQQTQKLPFSSSSNSSFITTDHHHHSSAPVSSPTNLKISTTTEDMIYSSLPPSTTNLNLNQNHHHQLPNSLLSTHSLVPSIQSKSHKSSIRPLSFFSSLSIRPKSRLLSKKQSSVTLSNSYSNSSSPQIHSPHISISPSLRGPSRVVAIVGNIRFGIGRLIVEDLVRSKHIVVALIDQHDAKFSQSLESLALSPSLFHAFSISALFSHDLLPSQHRSMNDSQSNPQLNHTATSPPISPTSARFKSFNPIRKRHTLQTTSTEPTTIINYDSPPIDPVADRTRSLAIAEIKNVLQSYRVDTVICCFEPIPREDTPRSILRRESEKQDHLLPPEIERSRIETMESIVLKACKTSGHVGRFAVCAHGPRLSPLTPIPSNTPYHHLDTEGSPITLTEFRWGFLMNELAADEALRDGLTGENGLGNWLDEPPHDRWMIDFENKSARLPCSSGNGRDKGKEKVEAVCFTLAEDVARFVSLACRLKTEWKWETGMMVGDKIRGGWEEVINQLETVSRTKYRREYHQKFTIDQSPASSKSSIDQYSSHSNPNPNQHTMTNFDDILRGRLAREGLDASSVRLMEFFRVWYSPLPKPPQILIDRSGGNHRQSLQTVQSRRQKNRSLLSPPPPAPSTLANKIGSAPTTTTLMTGNALLVTTKSSSDLTSHSSAALGSAGGGGGSMLNKNRISNSLPTTPAAALKEAAPFSSEHQLVIVDRNSYNFVPTTTTTTTSSSMSSSASSSFSAFKFEDSLRNQPMTSSPLAQKVS